ncbi:MAG: DinB family protein, partial [Phycisphaerales bacterium]|nr:DinB family protein [Phycisphaerales bacterium]
DACTPLPPETIHQRFEMGPGSLHDTLVHIIGAIRAWTDVLHGRELRPRPEQGPKLTPSQILAVLDESAPELAAIAAAHPLDEIVTRTRDGKTYSFTRGAVVTHITTHGMHHRAQCLNMLRQLGVNPLPKSSVMEWSLEGEPA